MALTWPLGLRVVVHPAGALTVRVKGLAKLAVTSAWKVMGVTGSVVDPAGVTSRVKRLALPLSSTLSLLLLFSVMARVPLKLVAARPLGALRGVPPSSRLLLSRSRRRSPAVVVRLAVGAKLVRPRALRVPPAAMPSPAGA